MGKDNNFIKESSSIIEEIESQLQDVLAKKKKQVEQELEEKIRQEQEEAKKRIDELEFQLKGDQEALVNYKNILSQFESNKEDLKSKIKDHLDIAIRLQAEIEEKAGLSLEELKVVGDLSGKLEEINVEATAKVNALKSELEDKYGIIAQVPESTAIDENEFNLETELHKLQKIKELLGASGALEDEDSELKKKYDITAVVPLEEAKAEEEPEKEEAQGAEPAAEAPSEGEAGETEAVKPESVEEESPAEKPVDTGEIAEETPPEEAEVTEKTTEAPLMEKISPPSEEGPVEISLSPELEQFKENESVRKAAGILSKYRNCEATDEDGEVVYYEKDGKIVLEGERLLIAVRDSLDKAKELYIKLSETESPKEQFFIKQEIIKHQDGLRKIMLSNIRWSEKETCSVPEFTQKILNPDVFKSLLEKVSMENWSNKDDFSSFKDFAEKLIDNYYKLISPPDKYYETIIDQLEKG